MEDSNFIPEYPGKIPDKVWYCCYGSNLSRKRFYCYIKGGSPEGSKKEYPGCDDESNPADDKDYTISGKLYFGGCSSTWGGSGVAFLNPDGTGKVLSRVYLVSKEQFSQIWYQENGYEGLPSDEFINLKKVIDKERLVIGSRWYNWVLYLDDIGDYPAFTFTSEKGKKRNKPSIEYLKIILRGLKELGYSDDRISSYLSRTSTVSEIDISDGMKELD